MAIRCSENNAVFVRRNGVYLLLPFCELEEGDYIPKLRSTVEVAAHFSGDASYDGWLLYVEDGRAVYPEDICFWTDGDMHQYVEDVWDDFGAVPMNPETECIEADWLHFPAGTNREEIWHWFENTFDCRVADLMYGVRESKRTEAPLKELAVKRELNEDTRKQGLFIDGVVYSLHITDHDEAIITDNTDYSHIYAIHSLDFYNLLTR